MSLNRTLSTLRWLPVGIVFTKYFYTVKLVTGKSMQPTLNPDTSQWRDLVIFDRYSIRIRRHYERGDVVALCSPVDASRHLVKRIIATPGDIVKTLPPYPEAEVRIPYGHVWVEGDDSFRTEDSNRFGPLPIALLDSRLAFVLWPFPRWGSLGQSTKSVGLPRQGEIASLERERRWKSRVITATYSP